LPDVRQLTLRVSETCVRSRSKQL